jgi:hypothetical protein
MALLVISINDQTMNKKSAEVSFSQYAVAQAMKELERGRGTVTSGTILGVSGAGVANTSLGSWTYTPSASLP